MNELLANALPALAVAVTDRLDAAFTPQSRSAVAALLTLRHWQPMTGTELARILGVTQPTSARLVQGLIRDGLVTRGTRQGRDVDVRLTDAGRDRADAVQAARLAVTDDLLGALSAEERCVLGKLIDRLLAAATPDRATARHICRFCDHERCTGPACPVGCRATAIENRAIPDNPPEALR